MKLFSFEDFVRESNRIEGIHRDPTPDEIAATVKFVGSEECPNIRKKGTPE